MQLSTEFWIQIVVYSISMGSLAGALLTKLRYLEKKQDKHNNLIERMVIVEQSTKSAHHRLDEIRGGLK
ncbi:MAG: hypothetical protein JRI72_00045 [Deltaproteobacteria bacterium]|nr:hypothetical protein [Deltaproteobacteria bacterium]